MGDNAYDLSTTAGSNTTIASVDVSGATGKIKDGDNVMRALGAYLAQVLDDLGAVNTVGGTGDAVTVTLASEIAAYATGQLFRFIAGAANTGAATMNVNSIGAKAIRKISGGTDVALSAGDIAAGETYLVIYRASANAAAGAWVLVGSTSSIPFTAASASGAASLQFAEDTDNGTNKVTLQGPASTADVTVTLPTEAGTLGVIVDEDDMASDSATKVPSQQSTKAYVDSRGRPTLGTATASTSGTSIDFTGIPSWVRRVTIDFDGVSGSGTSVIIVQIGAGSVANSGYSAFASNIANTTPVPGSYTTGFGISGGAGAGNVWHGTMTLTLMNGSNGTWACSGVMARSDGAAGGVFGGAKTLSGTLDRVRVTTVGGSDTFDAGTINITYE